MHKLSAEFIGTFFLVMAGTGAAQMGLSVNPDHILLNLIGGALAVGAVLYVFITLFAPISGAHFNPSVSLAFWLRGAISTKDLMQYIPIQIMGAVAGMWCTHVMFGLAIWQPAPAMDASFSAGLSEFIATFGLLMVILLGVDQNSKQIPALVACFVAAGYLMTATSIFGNPAVSIARALSQTPTSVGGMKFIMFMIVQLGAGYLAGKFLFRK